MVFTGHKIAFFWYFSTSQPSEALSSPASSWGGGPTPAPSGSVPQTSALLQREGESPKAVPLGLARTQQRCVGSSKTVRHRVLAVSARPPMVGRAFVRAGVWASWLGAVRTAVWLFHGSPRA